MSKIPPICAVDPDALDGEGGRPDIGERGWLRRAGGSYVLVPECEDCRRKTDGALQKQESIASWASRATDEQKLAKLDRWKKQAREKGFKLSWAYGTYRRCFGEDPPKVKTPPPPDMREILNRWDEL